MTLSSIISQRPANGIGEAEVATSRLASAKARTMPADRNDDFLLPLLDAARHINNYAEALARAHGLTQPQLIVIARLERKPRSSLDELAGLAGVTQKALTCLIDDLQTLGMIERYSDPPVTGYGCA